MQNRREFLAQSVATTLISVAAFSPEAQALDNDWATRLFEKRSHDFGVVARGSDTSYRLRLKNFLDQDVHIAEVRTTCGCTAGKPNQDTLRSQEEAYVAITMDTRKFMRRKDSNVIVVFDRPQYAEVTIPITAYIRTDVVVDPGSAQFGVIDREEQNERTLKIAYAGRDDWKIHSVKTNSDHISAKVTETSRASGRADYELVISLGHSVPFGALRQYITLLTDDQNSPQVPILVEAEVRPDITVNPSVVSLGTLTPGQTKTVQVVLRGRKPFEIESVTCDKLRDVFQVRLPKDAAPVQVIPLTVTAPDAAGTLDEELSITIPGRSEPVRLRAYAKIGARD